MKTSDFQIKPSSKQINESLQKKFGGKLDLENYSIEQLQKADAMLENKLSSFKKKKFNESLESEEFHKIKMMQDVIRLALTERAKSQSQQAAAGIALKHKKEGTKPKKGSASAEMMKMSTKELEKFAKTKHKGLPKKVDENIQTMGELADHHAKMYAEAHKKGNLEHAVHHRAKCEECGGMISHGMAGECYMSHPAIDSGTKKLVMVVPADKGSASPIGSTDMMATEASKKKSGKKPDFLDFDKDGNTKEPMTKALKDKKAKKTTENIIKESLQRFLREGEEGKAEVIMAVKDMVDKFTSWSEDIAQMQANTAMELADSIRDELGSDVSEQFKQAVGPALDQAFQAVKAARESINGMVGSITGEAPPSGSEEMGAEPPTGDADTGAEEPAGDIDTGAEAPAPAPDAEPADLGREKRESVERTRRLSKILVGR
jgi:hypothetical protein